MVKGIAGTAMSDIMNVTKLAKGSLYVHFENKEELSYAVVDYNLESLGSKMIGAMNRHSSSKAKIFALLKFFGEPLNTPLKGGCPMLNFGMEADDTNPVIREKVNKFIDSARNRVVSLVKKGVEDGEFVKNWDANDFSIKMFAMLEGGILMCRVAGKSESMKAIVRMLKKEVEEHTK